MVRAVGIGVGVGVGVLLLLLALLCLWTYCRRKKLRTKTSDSINILPVHHPDSPHASRTFTPPLATRAEDTTQPKVPNPLPPESRSETVQVAGSVPVSLPSTAPTTESSCERITAAPPLSPASQIHVPYLILPVEPPESVYIPTPDVSSARSRASSIHDSITPSAGAHEPVEELQPNILPGASRPTSQTSQVSSCTDDRQSRSERLSVVIPAETTPPPTRTSSVSDLNATPWTVVQPYSAPRSTSAPPSPVKPTPAPPSTAEPPDPLQKWRDAGVPDAAIDLRRQALLAREQSDTAQKAGQYGAAAAHRDRMRILDDFASSITFDDKNKHRGPQEVDLHGLLVNEAKAKVKDALTRAKSRGYGQLRVIGKAAIPGMVRQPWSKLSQVSREAPLRPLRSVVPSRIVRLFQIAMICESEQTALTDQLNALDIERVNRIYKKAVQGETDGDHDPIEPLPKDASDAVKGDAKEREWRKIGLQAIASGSVGVLLMAGGQGTRLGSSAPKGCYDIGLPSHKSLFQYQAERIARLQTVAEEEFNKPKGSVTIPWYVMTSGPTRPETTAYFEKNAYFGLDPKNVILFEQGTLPCLTMDGKVLLETPSRVAVAPDGNGGLYAATRSPLSSADKSHTVLSDLAKRNILYVHAYCVDNCLVRVADPVFIGSSIQKKADCAAKVVPKSSPTESVGVIARRGNKFSVVEYSEITTEQAEKRDPETGELAFRAGNIANHFYTTAFLNRVQEFEEQLAFHIARKKIAHVDLETGQIVKPAKPNGMKLEMFVFDVFPFTEHFSVLEVARNEEFSPLKNAPGTGSDDPETSRRDLLAQQKRFLEKAGATVAEGVEIEISPLVSYAGEGLESVKGKTFTKSGVVGELLELDALV
ncbi:hypothetical protein MKEN_01278600 [Mycena kentingensis (nom. inval.)]|nr:hypothetical protein MKEN_01278600 [Mycena kentingensis (nom. inval.)]